MDLQQVIKEQDSQIEDISYMVKRIRNNTKLINNEIDNQTMYFKIIQFNKEFR